MFRELLNSLFPRNDQPTRKTAHRPRLTLEGLEDRCVPAILVNTLADEVSADDGLTSLREAITQARTQPGADTIAFADGVSGPINLTQGVLMLNDPDGVAINGTGVVTLDAGQRSRVFTVARGTTATLEGLTLTHGSVRKGGSVYSDDGGGILIDFYATLTLTDSKVTNCTSGDMGGGIMNLGTLTLNGSEVSGNIAGSSGGGVAMVGGSMDATNSIFAYNQAGSYGGAIYTVWMPFDEDEGAVTLINSTVSHNATIRSDGGGIFNAGAIVVLSATSVDSNVAGHHGGGIYNTSEGQLLVYTSTFTANDAISNKGDDIYNTINSLYQIDEWTDIAPAGIYQEVSQPKGGGRR
jgi:CSLREA domain-containing protein